jgi:hypothetical protein
MSGKQADPSLINNKSINGTRNLVNENEILFQAGYLTIDRKEGKGRQNNIS